MSMISSPLMPFRAARSVVSSVTSVGTGLLPTVSTTKGLLPSMEQLGAIPVAGRILNHPVMDSTLNYIANKASERGISLASLTGGVDPRYAILPEDMPYRQLNKSMVQQAMTLAVLAVQKEEQSKSMDDEAGDDAFELYLAAINTLLHALPLETCDPLRREAYETQLRDYMDDHLEGLPVMDEYRCDPEKSKRHRRHRRRRQRQHHELASTLIQKHTANADQEPQNQQLRGQQAKQRKQRREQHTKQMQELKKQQQQAQQQQQQLQKQQEKEKVKEKEKEAKDAKDAKAKAKKTVKSASTISPPVPTTPTASIKSGKHSRRFGRLRSASQHLEQDIPHAHNQQGAVSTPNPPAGNGTNLGDAIVSTAVHSAIRLKQSPIPDVLKSCLRTSKTIFHKVDERFHLQEKAWELSKHSIEKAMELDEQYAIHEVVTDAVFATLTGLVKAGIAYKETPSYSDVRASHATGKASLTESKQAGLTAGTDTTSKPHNPQEIEQVKKQSSKQSTKQSAKQDKAKPSAAKDSKESKKSKPADVTTPATGKRMGWRTAAAAVAAPVVAEKNVSSDSEDDSEDSDLDSDEETVLPSMGSSTSSDAEEYVSDDDQDEVVELNQQTLRSSKGSSYGSGSPKGSSAYSTSTQYVGQVREKIDMFMALKGAASLIVGNL
ncbi:hypothetical protein BGZ65_012836 [Modicella reniformis]|uniref:Uncharacterized protein n=1 Tax=Modicella reniformis TaxID=1440133 RepID=A0A9P6IM93_9FUNG|nr:hypothetical protein BGZ65_012836 [Modicella reniformis]